MFIVAQLGARMHYAVPSILARANLLERLYTDTYAPRVFRSGLSIASKVGPASLRRWLGRVPADIPESKIVAFNSLGFEYAWRQRRAATHGSMTAAYLWANREFCRRAVNRGLGNASGVYTFNSAGLELLQFAHSQGLLSVMEQTIAPRMIEASLIDIEETDHPNWTLPHVVDSHHGALAERVKGEWEVADLILCGSEFVREGIRAAGGPVDRCRVVPYGVCPPA